jgi:probable rRNA maturation factor
MAEQVLEREKREAELSITFVGPATMREMNRQHKEHDWPTDVLSFPLTLPDGRLLGDIYICTQIARRQARRLGVPAREELARLIVHGVLHILGYDHPEDDRREGSPMWRRQERYVKHLERGR